MNQVYKKPSVANGIWLTSKYDVQLRDPWARTTLFESRKETQVTYRGYYTNERANSDLRARRPDRSGANDCLSQATAGVDKVAGRDPHFWKQNHVEEIAAHLRIPRYRKCVGLRTALRGTVTCCQRPGGRENPGVRIPRPLTQPPVHYPAPTSCIFANENRVSPTPSSRPH